jgi:two-component system, cell cycle sensor histidine kinase and response regulator CckA
MSQDPRDEQIRALTAEVQRLTAMLQSAPDLIARITPDGKFLYLNRLAPGFEMSEVLGASIEGYMPPEFHERAWRAIRAACETGETQEYATLGPVSAGKFGYYLTRVSPVSEDGQVSSLVMTATNVTALEDSRLLLEVALDATGLGIWTYVPATHGGSADETTRRIFGMNESDAELNLSSLLADRVFPEDRALVSENLARAIETGRYGPLEHRIVRGDGEVRWVAASGISVKDHLGQVARVVGSVMDVTHRRALEERLLEAQKLESIGRLAGGVAHDFNNMLTAILGNVDFASGMSSMEEVRPLLSEIRLTAERSAALTAQLLAFARRQLVEPKVLDLNQLVKRLEALLGRLLGEQVRLELGLNSVGHVRADASQLEQVVLNLITNARDSMPHGGRVQLETRDIELDELDSMRHPELAPGRYLRLTVTDNGVGIPTQALPKIFEPFFTTRQGGTGLGLATCYGIVKQNGGHISVESEPGNGATFSVYLPRVDDGAPDKTSSVPAAPGPSGSERLLLVEDEAVVRSIVERTLLRAKYRVVTATNGEEALQATEADGAFDLLITDVMMPGMSGWELGRRLRERWPSLRVLYISGYAEDTAEGPGTHSLPFLQKPFLPADLLATVRKLLDAEPPAASK